MAERLFGLETEYGIVGATSDQDGVQRDAIAYDLATRARDEVPGIQDLSGNGVFLQNGARFYVDCGHHPEMTTPEVANPWDVVRYILAGERILERLATPRQANAAGPLLLKTNIDYLTRSSWGCHESILHRIDPARLPPQIIPHLVSRVIYTGAGGFNPFSPGVEFVLSPRSLVIEHSTSADSTRGRGIFHTKDEALCNGGHRRLHIICGESLCSEIAMWLRTATTVLVVALVEGDVQPGAEMILDNPVGALRAIVGDPTCRGRVAAGGTHVTPLEIQRHYLRLAEAHARAGFMPPWAETACHQWRVMLDRLEGAPGSVSTILDWAIKRTMFERVLARRGFDWARVAAWTEVLVEMWARFRDDSSIEEMPQVEHLLAPSDVLQGWMRAASSLVHAKGLTWDGVGAFIRLRQELFECDVRFSQLGGEGIFASLDRAGVLTHHMPGVDNIEHAMENPPTIGRAKLRGEVIKRVLPNRAAFAGSWQSIVSHADHTALDLSNPFETEERWNRVEKQADRRPPARPLEFPSGPERSDGDGNPLERRSAALDCFLRGDCQTAQRILHTLLNEDFDVAGTHCHLARVSLKMGREVEARAHAIAAWEQRSAGPRYVVGRTLWFLALFALIDGADASPWIGRIKTLGPDGDAQMAWTMEPVLHDLRERMSPEAYAIASALFHALAGHRGGGSLHSQAWWCNTEPFPIG